MEYKRERERERERDGEREKERDKERVSGWHLTTDESIRRTYPFTPHKPVMDGPSVRTHSGLMGRSKQICCHMGHVECQLVNDVLYHNTAPTNLPGFGFGTR